MRMTRIILCCFGDKTCKMVGHIPRTICSAMIAVAFRVTPVLKLRSGVWLRHPPNKGCVIRDKTIRLTDEYVLNSEVCLTSRLYNMHISKVTHQILL